MANPLIQPDLILYSLLAGLPVGSGGFALVFILRQLGSELHPDTAQTWNLLWVALAYTAALMLLGIDVFVGGIGDFFYAALVAAGATVGYLCGTVVVGTPWVNRSETHGL